MRSPDDWADDEFARLIGEHVYVSYPEEYEVLTAAEWPDENLERLLELCVAELVGRSRRRRDAT